MQKFQNSSLFRLGAPQFAVGIALGVALGIAIAISLSSDSEEAAIFSVGDRVALTIPGQTGGGGGFLTGSGVSIEIPTEELPLTAVEAVATGWKDPVLCTPGRGRYFKKDPGGEQVPYLLMFDDLDSLIGIYQISETEMPTPWKDVASLEGGGLTIIDFQHWGLFVYFRDPVQACGGAEKGRATYGYREGRFGSQTRGTPTPVLAPTPTPIPQGLLETAAQNVSSLTSLSFTLTLEGDTQKVDGSVGPSGESVLQLSDPDGSDISKPLEFDDLGATLAGIARALQDPTDTTSAWINNVQSRGVSGTVSGQQLVALMPSAAAEARVTVKIWVDDQGLVRRVRIEGPVTPDDPQDVVRVLDVGSER